MSEQIMKNDENKSDLLTYSLSILLTTIIVIMFLFKSIDLLHPFIIPVYLSGVIIGLDLIDWFRGKIEVFDPIGFLGIFGFHFFFLAPILQIHWDIGMDYVIEPEDWRIWIFGISCINLIGLFFYRLFRAYFFRRELSKIKSLNEWKIDSRKLILVSIPTLFIMFLLQTYIYISYGGFSGYINTYTSREGGFEGMGFLFMLSESFPIIFIFLCFHFIQQSKYKNNIIVYIVLFIIFFFLKLYFGGLRGSRSNTLWGIIWFAGIFHCFVKPIKKRLIIIGSIFILFFIFIYGIYKGSGTEGLQIYNTDGSIMDIAEETGRGIDTLLLGDLSRIRTQAFILHRLVEYPESYKYALGRSYIGDISIIIPRKLYPDRQPTKVKEGTEIVLGKGNYNPNGYVSSRIYGLTGEFMLNFGYTLAPLSFIFLALFIGKIKGYFYLLNAYDARFYIYPYLVVTCFLILVQDLDNLIFSVIKNLIIPLVILLIIKKKNGIKERQDETSIRV